MKKKKSPLVSIIIPTYNRKELLTISVNSALHQTYNNIEVLVIDDGSTDNTKAIIKKINDKRIKYFYQKNQGVASARNLGLKKAKGDYISFLDSDDEYLPKKTECQINYLEKHNKLGFCYSNFFVIDNNRKSLYLNHKYNNSFHELITSKIFVTTQTVFFRASLTKKIGYFDKSFRICEDYDYWLRAAKLAKFGYINKPLATYKVQDIRLTNKILKVSEENIRVRLKHMKNYIKDLDDQDLRYQFIFLKGQEFFFDAKYEKANKYLLKSFKIHPYSPKNIIFILSSFSRSTIILSFFYYLYRQYERYRDYYYFKTQQIKNYRLDQTLKIL